MSVVLTAVLYVVPFGHVVGRPLVWLSTLAHELGHGFTALAVGGRFDAIVVSMDGSGLATVATPGAVRDAIVAAGGLLGPAVMGALCFAVARSAKGAKTALWMGVLTLLAVDVLWMSNLFGVLFATSLAAALAWLAQSRSAETARVVVSFLGTQLALSVFQRSDYLFAPVAQTARGTMPSDVAVIASVLWLPIPVWGALLGLTSVAVLAWGLWWSLGPWPGLGRRR